MNKKIFSPLFIFIFLSVNAQPDLKFVRYTTEHGLANNDVLSICQDSYGFIWFGTKDGCSRFDGIEFKNYQYDETVSGTIKSGWVKKIICDDQNNLWFAIAGLGGTLMRYDYETDIFIDVSSAIKEKLNIEDKLFDLWEIYLDSKGCIWTENPNYGFICYNTNNNTVEVYNQKTNAIFINPASYNYSKEDIWFTTEYGVFIYDLDQETFLNFKHDPNDSQSLSSDICRSIYRDSEGKIWVATINGLNRMVFSDSGTVRFKNYRHDPQHPFSLSSNLLYDISEDQNGNLLIATVNGLCQLNKKNNKIYRYFKNEIDNESINSNLIRTLYKDNHGNIWVGTDAGVSKLQVKNFKSYSQSILKNSISHNKVQYFFELPNSDVWIATPKGVDVFNRENEEFKFLMGITQDNTGLFGAPLVFFTDNDIGIWIGTWNGGFSYVNFSPQQVKNYITKPGTQEIVSVFSFFSDSKNNLWICTNNGLYAYNRKTNVYKKFSNVESNENSISSNYSFIATEDSDSNIWVGTLNGLNKLIDFEAGRFKRYLIETGTIIRQIRQVSDNYLWIATNKGLSRFNKSSQQFQNFDTDDGLPSNSVQSILEDSLHNFWISTDAGLAKIETQNDSIINITNYHKEDGINTGTFLERSSIKLKDGTMLFGGTEGFCMFKPSQIKTDTLPPRVVFTNLKFNNQNVKIGQKFNGQIILEKSIELTRHITLNHKNNAFSVQFAGLQYNMPKYNRYAYKLFGYEKNHPDWYYTDSENRKAEFINLPPGNYVLKVKAANSYGVWNSVPIELEITVLSPWWLTYWFISLIAILLVLIIVLSVRIRTYKLRKQKLKLARIVEQRTAELKDMNIILNERKEELEAQAEELSNINLKLLDTNTELKEKTNEVERIAKQLHEADQLKLKFFANISHEFRTPLSLIIAPVEKYLSLPSPIDWNKQDMPSSLKLISLNAKRLLRLINEIIDFRKIEQGAKKLSISANNIISFINDVVNAFYPLAEEKEIKLDFKVENPYSDDNKKSSIYNHFWFDSDVMGKILYNLISNAIKYTSENGAVHVQLSLNRKQSTPDSSQLPATENHRSEIIIKISDTGIGIKPEDLSKVFDRFYRVEDYYKQDFGGTGIGLAYTKELVELHKGNITVESTYGQGTAFTLFFPLSKAPYNNDSFIEKTSPSSLKFISSMIDIEQHKTYDESDSAGDTQKSEEVIKHKQSILIVEDNNDLRKFIKNELTEQYNVLEAGHGEEGWNIAIETTPDLIISDIMMPVMDGIEFCKKIKNNEQTSHIPIFLLTAKSGDENVFEGLETGANDYIFKPFSMQTLKLKIRNFFNLRLNLQEQYRKSPDMPPSEITYSVIDDKFLEEAVHIVKENLQNPDFDNDAFVKKMNYSRALIYKKIKVLTNQSLGEFINSIRIKTAANLFKQGYQNIKEVSYDVGFKHPNILTRHFKKAFGIPPSEYIKNQLKKDSP